MTLEKNEKTIGADVPIDLANRFLDSISNLGRHYKKKDVFEAFAKWWISLPSEEQKRFCSKAFDDTIESFSGWVRRLVEQEIQNFVDELESGKIRPPHELKMAESIENIKYFVRFKLPSAADRKQLQALRDLLTKELPSAKHKGKRA